MCFLRLFVVVFDVFVWWSNILRIGVEVISLGINELFVFNGFFLCVLVVIFNV